MCWPFNSSKKRIAEIDRRLRESQTEAFWNRQNLKKKASLKKLTQFANVGDLFFHMGIPMCVMRVKEDKTVECHSSEWGEYTKDTWEPVLVCNYKDANNVIRVKRFYIEDLGVLMLENNKAGDK